MNDITQDTVLGKMFRQQVADLGMRIAETEGSFLVRIIYLEGYSPALTHDPEWAKHIALRHDGIGLKTVLVDGKPKYRIITEAPSNPISHPWAADEIVNYRYTTRVERI